MTRGEIILIGIAVSIVLLLLMWAWERRAQAHWLADCARRRLERLPRDYLSVPQLLAREQARRQAQDYAEWRASLRPPRRLLAALEGVGWRHVPFTRQWLMQNRQPVEEVKLLAHEPEFIRIWYYRGLDDAERWLGNQP